MIRHLLFKFSRTWRRRVILATLGMILAAPAFALSNAQGWCELGGTNVIAPAVVGGSPLTRGLMQAYKTCTVTVYLTGTLIKATIYSDSSGTALANPYTATAFGRWVFYAADGTYDVAISGGGPPAISGSFTFGGVTINSPGGSATAFARPIWVEAAGCANTTATSALDLPTTNAAAAACATGTNIQKGVLQFVSTAATISTGQFTFHAPAGSTGVYDFNLIWYSAGTSGNMKWFVGVACTATNATATDDPAFTDSSVVTAAPGTTLFIQTSSITSVTGCSAGNLVHIRVKRNTSDAADTLASTVNLVGIETVLRITPQP